MSLAENLLNSLPTENISEDYSINEEEHIVIDNTRKITVPAKLKTIAVTGDKDVETVMIDCVRYWDNHDLSEFAIFLNYMLPNGETGTYVPYGVSRTDEYFTLEWIIGSEFTKYSGALQFLITARKVNENNLLVYQWSSLLNRDMNIQLGLEVTEPPEEELTTDVVTQILQSLNTKLSYTNIAHSTGNSDYLIMSQRATTEELNKRANAIIGKKSGTMVSMDDVAESGNVLANLRSKNLIAPNELYYAGCSVTRAGVTFTVNDDLSIHVKGSSTSVGDSWFSFTNFDIQAIDCSTGTYTVSQKIDGIVTNTDGRLTVEGKFINSDKTEISNCDINYDTTGSKNKVVTINQPLRYVGSIYLTPGIEVDCTIYLQLEKDSTATPYTPYVADDTAVTVKSCGKNLFGCYGSSVYGGYTVATFDGSHVSVNIPNSFEFFYGYETIRPYTTQYLPAGTYRVSWHNRKVPPIEKEYGVIVQTYSLDSNDIQTLLVESSVKQYTEYTFTLSKASKIYTSFYLINNTAENLDAEFDLMLTPISVDVEFEPYIEGETIETTMGSEDSNVLSPIAPNMTITTDNNGVILDVEYNRDSNIVIEKLTQAIISLGGNI